MLLIQKDKPTKRWCAVHQKGYAGRKCSECPAFIRRKCLRCGTFFSFSVSQRRRLLKGEIVTTLCKSCRKAMPGSVGHNDQTIRFMVEMDRGRKTA